MIVLVTHQWSGLGIATLLQRQGAEVVVATDFTGLDPDELEDAKLCGQGMVAQMPLPKALNTFRGTGALWVFDANDFPEQADQLRAQGEWVVGTSKLAATMENDRDQASKVAEALGMRLSETQEFTAYAKGIAFLKAHRTTAYVFKPYDLAAEFTFVPQPSDDPTRANEELQDYIASTAQHEKEVRFILQERLAGVEVNFDLWVSRGQPVAAFVDLEAKRRLTGDLGEMVGCAGDFLFQVPLQCPGIVATVLPYLQLPALRDYTGSVDANVMLVGGAFYFLENCFRFGYNAYPTMFYGLATAPAEEILWRWVQGHDCRPLFGDHIAASLSLNCPKHKAGFPILVPPEVEPALNPYSVYRDGDHLAQTGHWEDSPGCVIGAGPDVASAAQHCLKLAQGIAYPNKSYRTDLASAQPRTLPLARYQQLAPYFGRSAGPDPDEDAAATAVRMLTPATPS